MVSRLAGIVVVVEVKFSTELEVGINDSQLEQCWLFKSAIVRELRKGNSMILRN